MPLMLPGTQMDRDIHGREAIAKWIIESSSLRGTPITKTEVAETVTQISSLQRKRAGKRKQKHEKENDLSIL